MRFLLIAVLIVLNFGCGKRNTEQVCFDESGKINSYAKGFDPSEPPLIFLRDGVYKSRVTGEIVYSECKYSWGVDEPKGIEYWEAI